MSGTDTVDTVGLPNEPRSDSGNEGTIDVHLQPPPIRLGYLLILFGALTVAGSLAPAVWSCQADHNLSGGFALAQYIRGLGVFVVGVSPPCTAEAALVATLTRLDHWRQCKHADERETASMSAMMRLVGSASWRDRHGRDPLSSV